MLYRSKEFRSLDPYTRAQLILVREGAKQGAELDEQDEDGCTKEIDGILEDLKLNFTKSKSGGDSGTGSPWNLQSLTRSYAIEPSAPFGVAGSI